MSATEKEREKIRVDYSVKRQLLDLLGFPELLKDWKEQKQAAIEAVAQEAVTRAAIAAVVKAAGADTVIFTDESGKTWNSTYVPESAGKKLNKKKLTKNLGTMGKLDAATIKKIMAASHDDTSRMSYGKITLTGEEETANEEE